jgi:3-phosphoshikimate 1-carboxyvinyltransferase
MITLVVMLLVSASTFSILASGTKISKLSYLSMNNVKELTLQPIKQISGEFTLPGSKSLSNRVLLLSAVSEGTTLVKNLLDSTDISYMLDALDVLNIPLKKFSPTQVEIEGRGGPINVNNHTKLFLGNAGTAIRPLTGILSAGEGEFILDGASRMRERPIIDLIDGLQQLDVDIKCSDTGCPPVYIKAKGLKGGRARISGQISSQYLSALLMAAPLASDKIEFEIKDELISAPYVHMTMNLMRKYGIKCDNEDDKIFRVYPGNYITPKEIFIEGDASSASYFLAGGAITGGTVTVYGCGSESIQGDSRFAQILEKMGATVKYTTESITISRDMTKPLLGIDENCGDIPDVAMTLAIVGAFAQGTTKIRNVYNWRVKETERMVAMVNELTKLGVQVEEGHDYLIVHGMKDVSRMNSNIKIETYGDHRMAMCFSLIACAGVPVTILDPDCCSKTFPNYFNVLEKMTQSP